MDALLEVRQLHVRYGADVQALRGVSFSLQRGESLAIVGESGAGKSTLLHCLAGLISPPAADGAVSVHGRDMLGAPEERWRELRWETVAIALQGNPLNPLATAGAQIAETLRERRGMDRKGAALRARELAERALLAPDLLDRYPHELSGGERRRAMLAMVLALDPELVILDEPVAGLDPAARGELLRRVRELRDEHGFALVVASHDLPAAAQLAERCIVLYAGEAIEAGATRAIVEDPAHPYTAALLRAYPVMSTTKDLRPIRGTAPDPRAIPAGCAFWPRCTQSEPVCREQHPPLAPARDRLVACHFGGLKRLLRATGLHKTFRRAGREVRALDAVSFDVAHGEALGVVGPSGSGKTTLARILAGHLQPDAGEVEIAAATRRLRRRHVQLVMQDPWDALSPRLRVSELVGEPLEILAGSERRDRVARAAAVAEMLEAVGLPSSGAFLDARVHELSGGQLQRISLARALVARPQLLVADEPTSMLDASEQARLLVVLRERQTELGLALVLVSHDLAVVRKVTDRIVVLDAGRVVEEGSSARVCGDPRSETARRLVASAPAFELWEDR